MYLHLGLETVVKENDVIGIFDLDSTTVSKHTRNFINKAEKEKKTVIVSYELPKSFILSGKKTDVKVYISPLSSLTLYKRIGIL
jgi:hypothetical protein